ncbi:MAG: aromatic ring-hydroxylating dioxygenase subunit alpha [Actinomycetota bacterium]
MTEVPVASDAVPADMGRLIEPHRVHRRLYTDPDLYSVEMTRVFAASWCFLAHESQIPAPGDYTRTTLGGRPVVVTRGDSGEICALLNRCSHRGTVVVSDDTGCAKRFTCPYHGWTFANDGRLVGVPYPGNHPVEERSELGLGRLAVGVHRGFIFGTLHPDPVPLDEWLGPATEALDTIIDRHPKGQIRLAPTPQRLHFAGNWKLMWDNAADGMHATFAHDSYNVLGQSQAVDTVLDRDPGQTEMRARALPHGHMVVDQRPGIPQGPWATMRPMPFGETLERELVQRGAAPSDLDIATGSMVNLSLFPSLLFVGNQLLVVEPQAVDRTHLSAFLTLAPAAQPEVDLLRLRVDEDFISFGTPDDLDMFERVQHGLNVPEMEWVDVSRGLGHRDDVVLDDGTTVGPITSEAPQRGYLAHYARLMQTDVVTRAR